MILVTGGARSGKSTFAEEYAKKSGENVLYIATAIAFDEEMKERIRLHQRTRPKYWETYEGYINLYDVIEKKAEKFDCILFDCITILVTNLMFYYSDNREIDNADFKIIETEILSEIDKIMEVCKKIKCETIFVSNEVGMGIVPENKLSRQFRDIAGRVNQRIAKNAEQVFLLVSGIPMKIK